MYYDPQVKIDSNVNQGKNMTAITLTIDAPFTEPVTKKIHTSNTKPVTQQRLELIAKAVQVLNRLKSDEIRDLVDQIDQMVNRRQMSQVETELAAKLGVEPIDDQERRELENSAFKNFFEWRQELLRNSLTASEVAKLLNTKSRQTPHDRLKKNSLVAIQDNGVWKFPCWQFDPKGPDGVVAGLPDVLKALDVPNFSKISWLTQPNRAFNGLSPLQALKNNQKDEVLNEAKSVGII
ncbi:hypothetical protein [Aetokthonos hydrillicola]|jgi:hypothetical protein